jgi:hypothetical protein
MLRVTAGPSYSYDTHKLVRVNQDDPCVFENEHMSVKVNVKIKDFHGTVLRLVNSLTKPVDDRGNVWHLSKPIISRRGS